MAATTWQLTMINAGGGALTLSSLRLIAGGTPVDAGAVLSSSHAPTAGTLGNLIDGDLASTCTFAAEAVKSPGFYIRWVLPSPQEVDAIQASEGIYALVLAQLVGGTWQQAIAASSNTALTPPIQDLRNNATVTLTTPSQVRNIPITATAASAVATADGGLQLTAPNTQSFAAVGDTPSAAALFYGCSAEVEFKITSDAQAHRRAGIYLFDPRDSINGYRIATIDNTVVLSRFAGTVVSEVAMGSLTLPNGPLTLGQKYKLSVAVSSLGIVSAALNGVTLGSFATPGGPIDTVSVGVFNYGTTVFYSAQLAGRDPVYKAPQISTPLIRELVIPGNQLPAQGISGISLGRAYSELDVEFGGTGKVYGTVERKNTPSNVPLRRRVRLHRSVDGLLARETWSKPDGSYEFLNINMNYEYDTVAWDHEMSYRSVVANNLKPEAM